MSKEYIEREAAIKMIEEDLPEVVYYRKDDAIECLMCLPVADVVEVVRCKDCKYHADLDGGVKCQRMDGLLMTFPDDYCSYGRRKMD